MRRIALLILATVVAASTQFVAPSTANADCVCRCVNGQMVPLCESTIDVPPICPPTVCAIAPPAVRPVDPPRAPPVGASHCQSEQVYNPVTRQYEWQEVCR
jgi:hypothetical protein